jgi:hypothetical protein
MRDTISLTDVLENWARSLDLGSTASMQIGEISAECQHEYREYVGFSEAYRFCTKCDSKVPLETAEQMIPAELAR